MATIVLFAGGMSMGLTSLINRDHSLVRGLIASLKTDSDDTGSILVNSRFVRETERIGVVLSKYKLYRYGSAFLALLAMTGLMLSKRGWVHGIAEGLLVVSTAQVIIDHFSESRAKIYFDKLTQFR